MTNQVIPAEAVEAAAKVLLEMVGTHPDEDWTHEATKALEVAAPHMMAEAWDEGKDAVWTFMSNQDPKRERPANPYRPAT